MTENREFPSTLDLRRQRGQTRASGLIRRVSDTSSARPSRSSADWNYRPPQAGHWDEALDPSGHPRPHWAAGRRAPPHGAAASSRGAGRSASS